MLKIPILKRPTVAVAPESTPKGEPPPLAVDDSTRADTSLADRGGLNRLVFQILNRPGISLPIR